MKSNRIELNACRWLQFSPESSSSFACNSIYARCCCCYYYCRSLMQQSLAPATRQIRSHQIWPRKRQRDGMGWNGILALKWSETDGKVAPRPESIHSILFLWLCAAATTTKRAAGQMDGWINLLCLITCLAEKLGLSSCSLSPQIQPSHRDHLNLEGARHFLTAEQRDEQSQGNKNTTPSSGGCA